MLDAKIPCWWFYRKGSEIWANHNERVVDSVHVVVGDSTAKVVKFEQITTVKDMMHEPYLLVILPQR